VLRGSVQVMPAIADAACGLARERELVYGRGSLAEGVALRLVASVDGTEVAVWDFETIEPPLAECPWVLEELQALADKYQALAGVSMGPMGDRLDDMMREMVLSRCHLVKLLPGEVLVEKGKPVGGLFIVGAGRIELGADAGTTEAELGPGEFLFAQQIMGGGKAPTGARAGANGALLMATDRHAAHELMVSVPPLLELLAG
jgi:CRP-like cAMP-binding protein